ncbi:hypothetical protein DKM19_28225 [Streptosporangium sp. 'caverna']|nr:hypothetical protein DKM19_28225 [Streptosporangium sp. 'caverna']
MARRQQIPECSTTRRRQVPEGLERLQAPSHAGAYLRQRSITRSSRAARGRPRLTVVDHPVVASAR